MSGFNDAIIGGLGTARVQSNLSVHSSLDSRFFRLRKVSQEFAPLTQRFFSVIHLKLSY